MPPATSRIPVTDETRDRLKDFARGLDANYDGALNFLLDLLTDDEILDYLMSNLPERDESPLELGGRLRTKYRKLNP